jgi:hypothetical protein
MRKYLLLFLSFQFCFISIHAQKKFFFESIEIKSYVYTDDIIYTKDAWQKQFRQPYHPSAQKFDSLDNYEFFKEWFHFDITGGGGIQTRLQKPIPAFPVHSRNKLEWNTGLGFRTFRMKGIPYSSLNPYFDTSRVQFAENEQFQLRQSFIDVYNSAVLTRHTKIIPEMYGSIGFGFQFSFSVTNKIRDAYFSHQQQWNTAQHKWDEISSSHDTTLVPAKGCIVYAWTIPVGLGFDLSKKISMAGAIEYMHSTRSPALTEKKYSEAAMFQLSIRYKL